MLGLGIKLTHFAKIQESDLVNFISITVDLLREGFYTGDRLIKT